MVQKGQIIDVRKFLSSNKALSLSPYYKRIFLPNAEKALTKCLLEISDSGMKIGGKKKDYQPSQNILLLSVGFDRKGNLSNL